VNLGPAVNSSKDDMVASISADGLTLYFASYRSGVYEGYDLYVTTRATERSAWGQAVNLGPTVNSSATDRSPWISLDGLELHFESDRFGGYGKSDIYVTRRATVNDPWGQPANLGPVVNSQYNESWSCLSPDGRLLLFSDRVSGAPRPAGYGNADMWMAQRASLSSPWEPPMNLGAVANSPSHDVQPRISADGSTLYFSTLSGAIWENWQAPIFAGPACGDSDHPYPAVDLNKDCRVDFADLAVLLAHWLECTAPECD
jgi:Tol biopolymer transport system component